MWQKLAIGLFALAGVYVWASGDYTFAGPRYRVLAYAHMAAAQLEGPPPSADAPAGADDASVGVKASATETPPAAGEPPARSLVHLASLRSAMSAEQEWSRLQRSFPAELAGLELVVKRIQLGAKGVVYRVLADTSESPLSPGQLCTALRRNDQYCAPFKSGAS